MSDALLPVVARSSTSERMTTVAAVLSSVTLLGLHATYAMRNSLGWIHAGLLLLAFLLADLLSGIVHWTADTWGSEETPIIGLRLIRPFRVHHVNPADIVSRSFFQLNGDVAFGVLPILAAAFLAPDALRFFLVAVALFTLPTNQIHQWAHMTRAPALARGLQNLGLILDPKEHSRHHTAPHRSNFCITTGWCNSFLERTQLLACVETWVRRLRV